MTHLWKADISLLEDFLCRLKSVPTQTRQAKGSHADDSPAVHGLCRLRFHTGDTGWEVSSWSSDLAESSELSLKTNGSLMNLYDTTSINTTSVLLALSTEALGEMLKTFVSWRTTSVQELWPRWPGWRLLLQDNIGDAGAASTGVADAVLVLVVLVVRRWPGGIKKVHPIFIQQGTFKQRKSGRIFRFSFQAFGTFEGKTLRIQWLVVDHHVTQ